MKKITILWFLTIFAHASWGTSLDESQADVAEALKDQGFFAGTCEPVFSRELLPELSLLLDRSAIGSGFDDSQRRSLQIDWHLNITRARLNLEIVLRSVTGMASLPKPVEQVIFGCFRFIPDGRYRVQFLLSDDFGDWTRDTEELYREKPGHVATLYSDPLFWHQDRYVGINRNYRYVVMGIIEQNGVSKHQLRLGLAPKASLKIREKNSVLYSTEEVRVVKSLDSAEGVVYFIDQDYTKNSDVLVEQHTGFKTFISTTKPDHSWRSSKGRRASIASFFSDNFDEYMSFRNNDMSADYKRPKRRKFILRVMEIDSSFDSDCSDEGL